MEMQGAAARIETEAGAGGPLRGLEPQRNRIVVLMVLAALAMLLPIISNNYVLEVMTNVWF
ncbi:MAG: hypothetical protein P8X39_06820, partial [Desulfofustis sp.]